MTWLCSHSTVFLLICLFITCFLKSVFSLRINGWSVEVVRFRDYALPHRFLNGLRIQTMSYLHSLTHSFMYNHNNLFLTNWYLHSQYVCHAFKLPTYCLQTHSVIPTSRIRLLVWATVSPEMKRTN